MRISSKVDCTNNVTTVLWITLKVTARTLLFVFPTGMRCKLSSRLQESSGPQKRNKQYDPSMNKPWRRLEREAGDKIQMH